MGFVVFFRNNARLEAIDARMVCQRFPEEPIPFEPRN